MVLDHITFTFICEITINACLNLYEDPNTLVLKENLSSPTGIMVEKLVKLYQFTYDLPKQGYDTPQKRRWGLNKKSDAQPKSNRKFTPRPSYGGYGRGCNRAWNDYPNTPDHGHNGHGQGHGGNMGWSRPETPRLWMWKGWMYPKVKQSL